MQYHELFDCDPKSGTLTWKERPRHHFKTYRSWKKNNAQFSGKIAGTTTARGYGQVIVLGKLTRTHRIIWEMANGPIPAGLQIDHIDRDPSNNRLSNLRLATQSENMRNTGAYSTNTSGMKGVYCDNRSGKWDAQIQHHGHTIHLGRFATKGLAAVAYAKASLRYHGAFSRIHSSLIAAR